MAIEVDDELAGFLKFLSGEDFPVANEDRIARIAAAHVTAAENIDASAAYFVEGVQAYRAGLGGSAEDAFLAAKEQYVLHDPGYLAIASKYVHRMGDSYQDAAATVEYAKLMIIAGLIQLFLEFALALAMAWFNPAAALARIALIRQIFRILYGTTTRRVLTAIVSSQVAGIVLQVAMDLFVQLYQIKGSGTRERIDLALTRAAAEIGSLGGAFNLGFDGLVRIVDDVFKKYVPDLFDIPGPGPGGTPGGGPSPVRDPAPRPGAGPVPDAAPRPDVLPGPPPGDAPGIIRRVFGNEPVSDSIAEYLTEGFYGVFTEGEWNVGWGAAASGFVSGLVSMGGTALGLRLRGEDADDRGPATRDVGPGGPGGPMPPRSSAAGGSGPSGGSASRGGPVSPGGSAPGRPAPDRAGASGPDLGGDDEDPLPLYTSDYPNHPPPGYDGHAPRADGPGADRTGSESAAPAGPREVDPRALLPQDGSSGSGLPGGTDAPGPGDGAGLGGTHGSGAAADGAGAAHDSGGAAVEPGTHATGAGAARGTEDDAAPLTNAGDSGTPPPMGPFGAGATNTAGSGLGNAPNTGSTGDARNTGNNGNTAAGGHAGGRPGADGTVPGSPATGAGPQPVRTNPATSGAVPAPATGAPAGTGPKPVGAVTAPATRAPSWTPVPPLSGAAPAVPATSAAAPATPVLPTAPAAVRAASASSVAPATPPPSATPAPDGPGAGRPDPAPVTGGPVAVAPRAPGDAARMQAVLRAGWTQAPQPRSPMLGPDYFGVRNPAPRPAWLANFDVTDVKSHQQASFFEGVHLGRGALTGPPPLTSRSGTVIESSLLRTVPSRTGLIKRKTVHIPRISHSIWLGGPLAATGTQGAFRQNLELIAQTSGFDVVLWTDVTRGQAIDAMNAQPGSPAHAATHTVREFVEWAGRHGIRLVNVDEIFHADARMRLHDEFAAERHRGTGLGYASASDILRAEMLYRYGGVYTDGDNVLHDGLANAVGAVANSTVGMAVGDTVPAAAPAATLPRYNNAVLVAPARHEGMSAYLDAIRDSYARSEHDNATFARLGTIPDPPNPPVPTDVTAQGVRTGVISRTGPSRALFRPLAASLGVSPDGIPHLPRDVFTIGQAHTWEPAAAPPSRPHTEEETRRLVIRVAAALLYRMHAEGGALNLVAVRDLVEAHPDPEMIWNAVLGFLAGQLEVRNRVTAVIYSMTPHPAQRPPVALSQYAQGLFVIQPPGNRQQLSDGDYVRMVAPAAAPPAPRMTGAGSAIPDPTRGPVISDDPGWRRARSDAVAVVRRHLWTDPVSKPGPSSDHRYVVDAHFDARRFETGGTTVTDLTVRVWYGDSDAGTAGRVHAAMERGVRQYLNAPAYRLPGGGSLLHVTVERAESAADAHLVVSVDGTAPMDQRTWPPDADPVLYTHEIAHQIGLRDEYRDEITAPHRPDVAGSLAGDPLRAPETDGLTSDEVTALAQLVRGGLRDRHLYLIAAGVGDLDEPPAAPYRGPATTAAAPARAPGPSRAMPAQAPARTPGSPGTESVPRTEAPLVAVPADGNCLLYSALAGDPALVLARLREKLPDHPLLRDADAVAWLADPARVRGDVGTAAANLSTHTWPVPAASPAARAVGALADLVAHRIGDGSALPADVLAARHTFAEPMPARTEMLAELRRLGPDRVTDATMADPDTLFRRYVDVLLREMREVDPATTEFDARAMAAFDDATPWDRLARVEPFPLESLSDTQLAAELVTRRSGAGAPLTDGERDTLLTAVRSWSSSWDSDAGETFPALVAHALGVQLQVFDRVSRSRRTTIGADDAPPLVLFHNGTDHWDAGAEPGTALPEARPADLDADYGPTVDPGVPRRADLDEDGGLRLNPLWYPLESFPAAALRPGRRQDWRYVVAGDGRIYLGAPEAGAALRDRDWQRLLAGMRRADPDLTMTELRRRIDGTGDLSINPDFDAAGTARARPGRATGDLRWNADRNSWEVTGGSDTAAAHVATRMSGQLGVPMAVAPPQNGEALVDFAEGDSRLGPASRRRIDDVVAYAVRDAVTSWSGPDPRPVRIRVEAGGNGSRSGALRVEAIRRAAESALRRELGRHRVPHGMVSVEATDRRDGPSAAPQLDGRPERGAARRQAALWTEPGPVPAGDSTLVALHEAVQPPAVTTLTRGADGTWRADGQPLLLTAANDGLMLLTGAERAGMADRPATPGSVPVLVHGAGRYVSVPVSTPDGEARVRLTPFQLAQIIGAHTPGDDPIALISCAAGAIRGGFARRLASVTGRDVISPQGDVIAGGPEHDETTLSTDGTPWLLYTSDGGDAWDLVNDEVRDDDGAVTVRPFAGYAARTPAEGGIQGGVRLSDPAPPPRANDLAGVLRPYGVTVEAPLLDGDRDVHAIVRVTTTEPARSVLLTVLRGRRADDGGVHWTDLGHGVRRVPGAGQAAELEVVGPASAERNRETARAWRDLFVERAERIATALAADSSAGRDEAGYRAWLDALHRKPAQELSTAEIAQLAYVWALHDHRDARPVPAPRRPDLVAMVAQVEELLGEPVAQDGRRESLIDGEFTLAGLRRDRELLGPARAPAGDAFAEAERTARAGRARVEHVPDARATALLARPAAEREAVIDLAVRAQRSDRVLAALGELGPRPPWFSTGFGSMGDGYVLRAGPPDAAEVTRLTGWAHDRLHAPGPRDLAVEWLRGVLESTDPTDWQDLLIEDRTRRFGPYLVRISVRVGGFDPAGAAGADPAVSTYKSKYGDTTVVAEREWSSGLGLTVPVDLLWTLPLPVLEHVVLPRIGLHAKTTVDGADRHGAEVQSGNRALLNDVAPHTVRGTLMISIRDGAAPWRSERSDLGERLVAGLPQALGGPIDVLDYPPIEVSRPEAIHTVDATVNALDLRGLDDELREALHPLDLNDLQTDDLIAELRREILNEKVLKDRTQWLWTGSYTPPLVHVHSDPGRSEGRMPDQAYSVRVSLALAELRLLPETERDVPIRNDMAGTDIGQRMYRAGFSWGAVMRLLFPMSFFAHQWVPTPTISGGYTRKDQIDSKNTEIAQAKTALMRSGPLRRAAAVLELTVSVTRLLDGTVAGLSRRTGAELGLPADRTAAFVAEARSARLPDPPPVPDLNGRRPLPQRGTPVLSDVTAVALAQDVQVETDSATPLPPAAGNVRPYRRDDDPNWTPAFRYLFHDGLITGVFVLDGTAQRRVVAYRPVAPSHGGTAGPVVAPPRIHAGDPARQDPPPQLGGPWPLAAGTGLGQGVGKEMPGAQRVRAELDRLTTLALALAGHRLDPAQRHNLDTQLNAGFGVPALRGHARTLFDGRSTLDVTIGDLVLRVEVAGVFTGPLRRDGDSTDSGTTIDVQGRTTSGAAFGHRQLLDRDGGGGLSNYVSLDGWPVAVRLRLPEYQVSSSRQSTVGAEISAKGYQRRVVSGPAVVTDLRTAYGLLVTVRSGETVRAWAVGAVEGPDVWTRVRTAESDAAGRPPLGPVGPARTETFRDLAPTAVVPDNFYLWLNRLRAVADLVQERIGPTAFDLSTLVSPDRLEPRAAELLSADGFRPLPVRSSDGTIETLRLRLRWDSPVFENTSEDARHERYTEADSRAGHGEGGETVHHVGGGAGLMAHVGDHGHPAPPAAPAPGTLERRAAAPTDDATAANPFGTDHVGGSVVYSYGWQHGDDSSSARSANELAIATITGPSHRFAATARLLVEYQRHGLDGPAGPPVAITVAVPLGMQMSVPDDYVEAWGLTVDGRVPPPPGRPRVPRNTALAMNFSAVETLHTANPHSGNLLTQVTTWLRTAGVPVDDPDITARLSTLLADVPLRALYHQVRRDGLRLAIVRSSGPTDGVELIEIVITATEGELRFVRQRGRVKVTTGGQGISQTEKGHGKGGAHRLTFDPDGRLANEAARGALADDVKKDSHSGAEVVAKKTTRDIRRAATRQNGAVELTAPVRFTVTIRRETILHPVDRLIRDATAAAAAGLAYAAVILPGLADWRTTTATAPARPPVTEATTSVLPAIHGTVTILTPMALTVPRSLSVDPAWPAPGRTTSGPPAVPEEARRLTSALRGTVQVLGVVPPSGMTGAVRGHLGPPPGDVAHPGRAFADEQALRLRIDGGSLRTHTGELLGDGYPVAGDGSPRLRLVLTRGTWITDIDLDGLSFPETSREQEYKQAAGSGLGLGFHLSGGNPAGLLRILAGLGVEGESGQARALASSAAGYVEDNALRKETYQAYAFDARFALGDDGELLRSDVANSVLALVPDSVVRALRGGDDTAVAALLDEPGVREAGTGGLSVRVDAGDLSTLSPPDLAGARDRIPAHAPDGPRLFLTAAPGGTTVSVPVDLAGVPGLTVTPDAHETAELVTAYLPGLADDDRPPVLVVHGPVRLSEEFVRELATALGRPVTAHTTMLTADPLGVAPAAASPSWRDYHPVPAVPARPPVTDGPRPLNRTALTAAVDAAATAHQHVEVLTRLHERLVPGGARTGGPELRPVGDWAPVPSWRSVEERLRETGPGSVAMLLRPPGTADPGHAAGAYLTADGAVVWLEPRAGADERLGGTPDGTVPDGTVALITAPDGGTVTEPFGDPAAVRAERLRDGLTVAAPVAGTSPSRLGVIADGVVRRVRGPAPAPATQTDCVDLTRAFGERLYGRRPGAGTLDDAALPAHRAAPRPAAARAELLGDATWAPTADLSSVESRVRELGPGASAFVIMTRQGDRPAHALVLHHTDAGPRWIDLHGRAGARVSDAGTLPPVLSQADTLTVAITDRRGVSVAPAVVPASASTSAAGTTPAGDGPVGAGLAGDPPVPPVPNSTAVRGHVVVRSLDELRDATHLQLLPESPPPATGLRLEVTAGPGGAQHMPDGTVRLPAGEFDRVIVTGGEPGMLGRRLSDVAREVRIPVDRTDKEDLAPSPMPSFSTDWRRWTKRQMLRLRGTVAGLQPGAPITIGGSSYLAHAAITDADWAEDRHTAVVSFHTRRELEIIGQSSAPLRFPWPLHADPVYRVRRPGGGPEPLRRLPFDLGPGTFAAVGHASQYGLRVGYDGRTGPWDTSGGYLSVDGTQFGRRLLTDENYQAHVARHGDELTVVVAACRAVPHAPAIARALGRPVWATNGVVVSGSNGLSLQQEGPDEPRWYLAHPNGLLESRTPEPPDSTADDDETEFARRPSRADSVELGSPPPDRGPATARQLLAGLWNDVHRRSVRPGALVQRPQDDALLGRDPFGLRDVPPPPTFLAGVEPSRVFTGRLADLFRRLDLTRQQARPDLADLAAGTVWESTGVTWTGPYPAAVDLPHGRLEHVEMPAIVHTVWYGSPLDDSRDIRDDIAATSRTATAQGFTTVLWTDLGRDRFLTPDPAVAEMRRWAVEHGIVVVDVHEVFHAAAPMMLRHAFALALSKGTGAGFAEAKDISLPEILWRFGGIGLDADNVLLDATGLEQAFQAHGYALEYIPAASNFANSSLMFARHHPVAHRLLVMLGRNYDVPLSELDAFRHDIENTGDTHRNFYARGDLRHMARSIMERSGPVPVASLVLDIGHIDPETVPMITPAHIRTGTAHTWLPEQTNRADRPVAGPPAPLAPEAVAPVLRSAVTYLIRELTNRDGDLHLVAVEPLIARLPDPDAAWEAVVGFILSAPGLRYRVRTVTYARWVNLNDEVGDDAETEFRAVALPAPVLTALGLPPAPGPDAEGAWRRGAPVVDVDLPPWTSLTVRDGDTAELEILAAALADDVDRGFRTDFDVSGDGPAARDVVQLLEDHRRGRAVPDGRWTIRTHPAADGSAVVVRWHRTPFGPVHVAAGRVPLPGITVDALRHLSDSIAETAAHTPQRVTVTGADPAATWSVLDMLLPQLHRRVGRHGQLSGAVHVAPAPPDPAVPAGTVRIESVPQLARPVSAAEIALVRQVNDRLLRFHPGGGLAAADVLRHGSALTGTAPDRLTGAGLEQLADAVADLALGERGLRSGRLDTLEDMILPGLIARRQHLAHRVAVALATTARAMGVAGPAEVIDHVFDGAPGGLPRHTREQSTLTPLPPGAATLVFFNGREHLVIGTEVPTSPVLIRLDDGTVLLGFDPLQESAMAVGVPQGNLPVELPLTPDGTYLPHLVLDHMGDPHLRYAGPLGTEALPQAPRRFAIDTRPLAGTHTGLALLPEDQARAVPDRILREPGKTFVVLVHAAQGGVRVPVHYDNDETGERIVTVRQLAELLAAQNIPEDATITLLSCSAGALDNGFALTLAELMRRDVLAPVSDLFVRTGDGDHPALLTDGGESWTLSTPSGDVWDVVNDDVDGQTWSFQGFRADDLADAEGPADGFLLSDPHGADPNDGSADGDDPDDGAPRPIAETDPEVLITDPRHDVIVEAGQDGELGDAALSALRRWAFALGVAAATGDVTGRSGTGYAVTVWRGEDLLSTAESDVLPAVRQVAQVLGVTIRAGIAQRQEELTTAGLETRTPVLDLARGLSFRRLEAGPGSRSAATGPVVLRLQGFNVSAPWWAAHPDARPAPRPAAPLWTGHVGLAGRAWHERRIPMTMIRLDGLDDAPTVAYDTGAFRSRVIGAAETQIFALRLHLVPSPEIDDGSLSMLRHRLRQAVAWANGRHGLPGNGLFHLHVDLVDADTDALWKVHVLPDAALDAVTVWPLDAGEGDILVRLLRMIGGPRPGSYGLDQVIPEHVLDQIWMLRESHAHIRPHRDPPAPGLLEYVAGDGGDPLPAAVQPDLLRIARHYADESALVTLAGNDRTPAPLTVGAANRDDAEQVLHHLLTMTGDHLHDLLSEEDAETAESSLDAVTSVVGGAAGVVAIRYHRVHEQAGIGLGETPWDLLDDTPEPGWWHALDPVDGADVAVDGYHDFLDMGRGISFSAAAARVPRRTPSGSPARDQVADVVVVRLLIRLIPGDGVSAEQTRALGERMLRAGHTINHRYQLPNGNQVHLRPVVVHDTAADMVATVSPELLEMADLNLVQSMLSLAGVAYQEVAESIDEQLLLTPRALLQLYASLTTMTGSPSAFAGDRFGGQDTGRAFPAPVRHPRPRAIRPLPNGMWLVPAPAEADGRGDPGAGLAESVAGLTAVDDAVTVTGVATDGGIAGAGGDVSIRELLDELFGEPDAGPDARRPLVLLLRGSSQRMYTLAARIQAEMADRMDQGLPAPHGVVARIPGAPAGWHVWLPGGGPAIGPELTLHAALDLARAADRPSLDLTHELRTLIDGGSPAVPAVLLAQIVRQRVGRDDRVPRYAPADRTVTDNDGLDPRWIRIPVSRGAPVREQLEVARRWLRPHEVREVLPADRTTAVVRLGPGLWTPTLRLPATGNTPESRVSVLREIDDDASNDAMRADVWVNRYHTPDGPVLTAVLLPDVGGDDNTPSAPVRLRRADLEPLVPLDLLERLVVEPGDLDPGGYLIRSPLDGKTWLTADEYLPLVGGEAARPVVVVSGRHTGRQAGFAQQLSAAVTVLYAREPLAGQLAAHSVLGPPLRLGPALQRLRASGTLTGDGDAALVIRRAWDAGSTLPGTLPVRVRLPVDVRTTAGLAALYRSDLAEDVPPGGADRPVVLLPARYLRQISADGQTAGVVDVAALRRDRAEVVADGGDPAVHRFAVPTGPDLLRRALESAGDPGGDDAVRAATFLNELLHPARHADADVSAGALVAAALRGRWTTGHRADLDALAGDAVTVVRGREPGGRARFVLAHRRPGGRPVLREISRRPAEVTAETFGPAIQLVTDASGALAQVDLTAPGGPAVRVGQRAADGISARMEWLDLAQPAGPGTATTTAGTSPAGHRLLQRLAGRLPDATIAASRQWLAAGDLGSVTQTVLFALSSEDVAVTEEDARLLLAAGAAPADVAALPRGAAVPPFRFAPSGPDPSGDPPPYTDPATGYAGPGAVTDLHDRAAVDAAGAARLWRTWRYPVSGDGPPKRVYLLLAAVDADVVALTAAVQAALAAAGETDPQVEVFVDADDLPPYQRAALDDAVLLRA
ncbi:hypothetical protein J2S43_001198 [Catenuloplanes nepalensis]|uniref:Outer membrane channel protein CpnT-like N-terminal domain-containing protein n=1 Tax=Catenuloplanes nepalensis TaxID=587533 RepID=A0ABT9MMM3_9ACTN|nr:hypothetical protein [Catenuloplanes nepalensis]MDP9792686.1 hypothetical protein [Catenuloplanes nepalensis]